VFQPVVIDSATDGHDFTPCPASNHPTIQPSKHPTIQPSNHPTLQLQTVLIPPQLPCCSELSLVDSIPKQVAWFEGQYTPGLNGNRLAGLRIAAATVFLLLDLKAAETGNFQLLAGFESAFHNRKERLHHRGGFLFCHSGTILDLFKDISFGHDFPHIFAVVLHNNISNYHKVADGVMKNNIRSHVVILQRESGLPRLEKSLATRELTSVDP
jgi:hypothetical protein